MESQQLHFCPYTDSFHLIRVRIVSILIYVSYRWQHSKYGLPCFNSHFLSPGMTLSTLRHIRATHNVVMGYFSHVAQCNHFSWLTSESTRHLWHCFIAYINSCNELRNNTIKVTKLWTYWLDLKLTEDIWSWTTLVDISNVLTVALFGYNEL